MLSAGNGSNPRKRTGREARKDGGFKVLHSQRTGGLNWRREVTEHLVRNEGRGNRVMGTEESTCCVEHWVLYLINY